MGSSLYSCCVGLAHGHATHTHVGNAWNQEEAGEGGVDGGERKTDGREGGIGPRRKREGENTIVDVPHGMTVVVVVIHRILFRFPFSL